MVLIVFTSSLRTIIVLAVKLRRLHRFIQSYLVSRADTGWVKS